jgi:hypothetical protein
MGVLDSLKRKGLINNKIYYRFASYRLLDEIPHHVFAVIQDKNGNEFFIDPVLSTFNERKTYYHKIDKQPSMPLYSVSGIGATKKKAATKAVAPAAELVKWTKGKFATHYSHSLKNGLLMWKGGDLKAELSEVSKFKPISYFIKDYMEEPFFETKQIVHLPMV